MSASEDFSKQSGFSQVQATFAKAPEARERTLQGASCLVLLPMLRSSLLYFYLVTFVFYLFYLDLYLYQLKQHTNEL
jgi:hypothetical protein